MVAVDFAHNGNRTSAEVDDESMLSDVQVCVQFIEAGGREALITCPDVLPAASEGKTGTRELR